MSDDSDIQRSQPASFDVAQPSSRSLVRREIIKLFRTSELSPRQILERLLEHFYASPVSEQDRRMFLCHATSWVREEALIRGAAATPRPNIHSDLLDAFRYLDQADPSGARMLELTYVAEVEPEEIANILDLTLEAVARKLQTIQSWLRRVAAGEPHSCYQVDPSRPPSAVQAHSKPLQKML